jgi:hypothetical protein
VEKCHLDLNVAEDYLQEVERKLNQMVDAPVQALTARSGDDTMKRSGEERDV